MTGITFRGDYKNPVPTHKTLDTNQKWLDLVKKEVTLFTKELSKHSNIILSHQFGWMSKNPVGDPEIPLHWFLKPEESVSEDEESSEREEESESSSEESKETKMESVEEVAKPDSPLFSRKKPQPPTPKNFIQIESKEPETEHNTITYNPESPNTHKRKRSDSPTDQDPSKRSRREEEKKKEDEEEEEEEEPQHDLGSSLWICELCDARVKDFDELREHVITAHDPSLFGL